MGKFKCHSPAYSCAKQYGTVLCSHNQGGTLTSSACGQSVDFISQYELMTREQRQLLHLVKSTIVKVPPHADSEWLPAGHSWAQPPVLDSSRSFSACKGFFPTPLPVQASPLQAGMWLGWLCTLLESWCQTHCFLVTTSLSICPAEPPSDSLWSQAESQIFPSHPHTGGLALLPNAAFSSWHMQSNTGLFQIKTKSRVPSPKYYKAQIFTALSSLTRWSIWWLFRTQHGLFSRICCRNGWLLLSLKTFLTFNKRQDSFAASFLQCYIPCRGDSSYNYPWKITDKAVMGLIVRK